MHKNIGFLLFNDVEELDFIGPWEMFSVWGQEFSGPNNLFTVSETGGEIKCRKGLRIMSDYNFRDCPQIDILLVPGGMGTRVEVDNKHLIDFIRKQALACQKILSVCTGAFLLEKAGLLVQQQVTTHWKSLSRLRQLNDLDIREERYVINETIWTSAGISAGIDMALAFIAAEAGEVVAGQVQLQTEYYPSSKIYPLEKEMDELPEYLRRELQVKAEHKNNKMEKK